MTCWTSYSSRAVFAGQLLLAVLMSNCASLESRKGAPLEFESLVADRDGPRAAGSTTIRWTASSRGGRGALSYEFRTLRDCSEVVEQRGPSRTWHWNPEAPGTFRVRVIVRDTAGASADSGWSPAYLVIPLPDENTPVAMLPIENLSAGKAPLRLMGQSLRTSLSERGFRLLEDELLEEFMRRHRVRHTGGVSSSVARAIKEETGVEAILVTSLEAYKDAEDPKISLVSRLLSSGEKPEIICMEGVGLSGKGFTGLLGLGQVKESAILLERAVRSLGDALARCVSAAGPRITVVPAPDRTRLDDVCGGAVGFPERFHGCGAELDAASLPPQRTGKRRYLPRQFFRSPIFDPTRSHTVAVIPFLNLTDRKHAGNILTLHFVDQLSRNPQFEVKEPGLVREQLLKYRIIMEAGPSLANTDIIASRSSLDVDLVFSGTVFDYQDAVGVPKVDFATKIIDNNSRQVVWASRSYNSGDEGVFFFDLGRVRTAHRLAAAMARGALEVLTRRQSPQKRHRTNTPSETLSW